MKLFFVGSLYPKNRVLEFSQNSKKFGLDNAANNFQWALLGGAFAFYNDVFVLSQPALRSFPLSYNKIVVSSSEFLDNGNLIGKCIGFFNIFPISHLSKMINFLRQLLRIIPKNEESVVIVYAISSPFLASIFFLQKLGWSKCKFCLVIPDLPQFMYETNNKGYLFLKKIDYFFIEKLLKYFDGFVLLTKYMAEAIPLYNKPHIVIEGIYTKPDYLIEEAKKTQNFTFFYSGSLHKRFGILSLIEAFSLIKNNSIRLWICGSGDADSFVREACNLDSRITYYGELLHEEVLQKQQQATMLINPRNSDGEYTKYSFPSKTLEYFASGTPAIIHRLPGIPENYFSYCFCPLNSSVSALADCMLSVINMEREELQKIGQKAKAFIVSEKNSIIQFNKIYDFINNL